MKLQFESFEANFRILILFYYLSGEEHFVEVRAED
jgi:hypothetical protein